jgi:hypothetical protein
LQYQDVVAFVRECDNCQRNKLSTSRPAGRAYTLEIPSRPWQSIAIDFLGPLTVSHGMKNIIVVVDRFSGSIVLIPMPEKFGAADVARVMIQQVYAKHGIPQDIVSDRDRRFISSYWKEFNDYFECNLSMATAFHQQTNGSAERAVKTVTQILRAYINAKQNNWMDNLWRAEYAMNNSPTDWCGKTPLEICYGQAAYSFHTGPIATRNEAVNQHLEDLRVSNKIAQDALERYRLKQVKYSAARRNPKIVFKVGDLVMYKRRTFERGKTKKLHTLWRGPYAITKIGSKGNCTLDLSTSKNKQRHRVFATDMLKLYHDNKDYQRRIEDISDDADDDEPEYEIEQLVNHKTVDGKDFYLVRWKGYDQDEDTWEPREELEENASEILADYLKGQ